MSAPASAPPRSFDAGTATLERVLTNLRLSIVDDDVYEDLEEVLRPYADLDAIRTAKLTVRLRLALADALPAVRHTHGHLPVVARAVELRDREQPEHPDDARGHLRLLALAALDMLDLLAPNVAPPPAL